MYELKKMHSKQDAKMAYVHTGDCLTGSINDGIDSCF